MFCGWNWPCMDPPTRFNSYCARGDTNGGQEMVEQEKDPNRKLALKSIVLDAISKQTGDAKPLAQHLEEYYDALPSAHILLGCCRAKHQCADWGYIALHAKELLKQVNTEAVLRLVLDGAFQAHEYELCLQLIQDNKTLFTGGKTPGRLEKARD